MRNWGKSHRVKTGTRSDHLDIWVWDFRGLIGPDFNRQICDCASANQGGVTDDLAPITLIGKLENTRSGEGVTQG